MPGISYQIHKLILDAMEQQISCWRVRQKILWHIVTLVVRKDCDVSKVVTLVGGVALSTLDCEICDICDICDVCGCNRACLEQIHELPLWVDPLVIQWLVSFITDLRIVSYKRFGFLTKHNQKKSWWDPIIAILRAYIIITELIVPITTIFILCCVQWVWTETAGLNTSFLCLLMPLPHLWL